MNSRDWAIPRRLGSALVMSQPKASLPPGGYTLSIADGSGNIISATSSQASLVPEILVASISAPETVLHRVCPFPSRSTDTTSLLVFHPSTASTPGHT